MKAKYISLTIVFVLIGFLGYSQTDILDYNNTVNTQYKIRCTWVANGIPYSTPYPGYVLISGNSSGSITVPQNNASLTSFAVQIADCVGPWIPFTVGIADLQGIDECNQCLSGDANVGYTGYDTPNAWVGIKCKN